MTSLMVWLRRRFCRHQWECISDVWTCTALTVRYCCERCGKEEGLYP